MITRERFSSDAFSGVDVLGSACNSHSEREIKNLPNLIRKTYFAFVCNFQQFDYCEIENVNMALFHGCNFQQC